MTEIEVQHPPLVAEQNHAVDRPLRAMMENVLGDLDQLDMTHGVRLGGVNHHCHP